MAVDARVEIKTGADTSGVEKASRRVGDLKGAAESASAGLDAVKRSSGEAAGAISAIGGAVSVVDPRAGALFMTVGHLAGGIKGLGAALKSLLVNPVVLAVTAAVAAFALWRKHVNDTREALVSLYDSVTKGINGRIAKENREIAASYREMANAIDDAADRQAHLDEMSDMRKANARAYEDARTELDRQVALSGAGSAEEKAAVEREFARRAAAAEHGRTVADVDERAERAYGEAAREDFAKRRRQVDDELAARTGGNGTLEQKERLVRNAEVMSRDETLDEGKRKEYADSIDGLRAAVEEERATIAELGRRRLDLVREEEQAQEKALEILRGKEAADARLAAEELRLESEAQDARNALKDRIAELERDAAGRGGTETKALRGERLGDRISQMGGFATAGAKAAAGATTVLQVEREIKDATVKALETARRQLAKLEEIERKTGGGATFS